MSLTDFLNESLVRPKPLNEPLFFIETSFKGWVNTVNKVVNLVPNEAIPDVVCSFSQINKITSSKIITPNINKSKNGVSINRDSISLPINLADENILKKAREFSIYNNDDEGWKRYLELAKTIRVDAKTLNRWSFNIVSINSKKYKTPSEMSSSKLSINEKYFKDNGKYWWVNTDGASTLCHEFGHVYDRNKKVSSKSDWKSLVDRWIKEDNAPQYCHPIKYTSSFNQGEYSESFAEAFANTIIHKGKDIPSYIKDYIKKLI